MRPLKVCNGWIEPVKAPRLARGASSLSSSAPLVCRTIFLRHSSPPIRASSEASWRMALSGVVMRIIFASRTRLPMTAWGCPAPMARTAARADAADRVTTAPMLQSSSHRRRPRARPRRPAPTIAIVAGIARDRIALSQFTFLENRIAYTGNHLFFDAGAAVDCFDRHYLPWNGKHSFAGGDCAV